jgi:hypothetical protein
MVPESNFGKVFIIYHDSWRQDNNRLINFRQSSLQVILKWSRSSKHTLFITINDRDNNFNYISKVIDF